MRGTHPRGCPQAEGLLLFRYDVRWIACKKYIYTAYELQMTRIGDTAEQHIYLAHREHALQATADDVPD